MKTIGIDANVLTRMHRTGTERYVSALLRHMQQVVLQADERVILYVSKPVSELSTLPPGWEERVLSWGLKKGWTHVRLSFELRRNPPDIFFSPAHEIPLFAPRISTLATIHDVAFHALPELYSKRMAWRHAWSLRRQIRRSTHLLTVSEATRQDVHTFAHVPLENMTVTPLAVDEVVFALTPYPVNLEPAPHGAVQGGETPPVRSYFIYIGRLEKKKNTAFLIDAFSQYAKTGEGDLVLGGSFGFGREEIEAAIARSGVKDRIHVLGFVPDADLPSLMAGAKAFVFPTLYEGFGMPVLEAMTVGTPVIASDISIMHEVLHDAALYADPRNEQAWASNMHDVDHRRDDLIAKGQEQVKKFSWGRTAEKTWEAIRQILWTT